jgi:hypothetical protein
MFNPNEMSDDKQTNWGTLAVPGASHPIYQFGSGGARTVSFSIYLDGDRGRYARNGDDRGRGALRSSLSIGQDIRFYQSLVYPFSTSTLDMATVFPRLAFFTFGPMYQAMPCIIKLGAVKTTYWTPALEPVRAIIPIRLEEVPIQSIDADTIFNSNPLEQ